MNDSPRSQNSFLKPFIETLESVLDDADRLDVLEKFVAEHGALVLHDGTYSGGSGGMHGLGFSTPFLDRSLRQALDSLRGKA